MPQIKVNEIDQSVYTRVVTDDKVRVFVPGIASFGPGIDPELTDINALTFTDVTEFEKTFGYTEPEYNPFKDDVSRIYAKQLIQRGAAVTFVKINNGIMANFNVRTDSTTKQTDYMLLAIEPSDWENNYTHYYKKEGNNYVAVTGQSAPAWQTDTYYSKIETVVYDSVPCAAAYTNRGNAIFELLSEKPSDWTSNYKNYYEIKEECYTKVKDNTVPEWANDKYYKLINTITPSELKKYQFAPQIASITAAYDGSFGNRLLVTFSPVNSTNRNFTYQYSMVSVYRADIKVESKKDISGSVKNTTKIIGVHKLESHIVTTNPKDVNYFENVEFRFIKINATANAYDELSLTWSNLESNSQANTVVYSGFPNIPLKYLIGTNETTFNEYALLHDGLDFNFNTYDTNGDGIVDDGWDLNTILKDGFGGFDFSTDATGKTKYTTLNKWTWVCYNPTNGIINTVLTTLQNCYANYSDPYVYDFDFITSGGFLNESFRLDGKVIDPEVSEIPELVTEDNIMYYTTDGATKSNVPITAVSDRNDSIITFSGVTPIHQAMKNLVEERQDCIAVFDVNPYWLKEELPTYVTLLNTSYGAVHAPWCYINNPEELGTLLMPPSFIFLYTMLSNLINNVESQKWFPPAGVTRATARVVVKPLYEIGTITLNQWQNDTLARVNPIMKLKQYGYVIYGNSTTYVAQDEYTHSALESLNIRLISNCVKKQIFSTCLKLAFEPNNSSLWMRFYDSMDKYLLFMKRNDGVYDYRIQMDEGTVTTDDINELRCPGKVWINPTRTAEFFDIDFILTEAGVTFTDTVEEGV